MLLFKANGRGAALANNICIWFDWFYVKLPPRPRAALAMGLEAAVIANPCADKPRRANSSCDWFYRRRQRRAGWMLDADTR